MTMSIISAKSQMRRWRVTLSMLLFGDKKIMNNIDLTTPSLLFSAISLIMLAYTNRFLAYASIMRQLKKEYQKSHDPKEIKQIENLNLRLNLIRAMQIFGISSLLMCVIATLLLFLEFTIVAGCCFGMALLALTISLGISIWEINISTAALKIDLSDVTEKK